MRKVLPLLCVALLGLMPQCSAPTPSQQEALVAVALAVVAQEAGSSLPPAVVRDCSALIAGQEVVGVAITEENQILSPVTGKPCLFVTKDGLTGLGVLTIRAVLDAAKAVKPTTAGA